jgi:putative transposase
MKNDLLKHRRKSYMDLGEIFFWTATINNWQKLLWSDMYKDVIIDSLDYLSTHGKVDVFGFVIMPTHVHFIWRANELNGKETPQGSFLKYTAHQFRNLLGQEDFRKLWPYRVDAGNKDHEFWQRDSLAVHLYTRKVAFQKLNYIHWNPLAKHWRLAKDPCDYKYSSARYYELGEHNFSFLKDLKQEFGWC